MLVHEENSDKVRAREVSFVRERLCFSVHYRFSMCLANREMDRKRKQAERELQNREGHKEDACSYTLSFRSISCLSIFYFLSAGSSMTDSVTVPGAESGLRLTDTSLYHFPSLFL